MDETKYKKTKEEAKALYKSNPSIYNPYFKIKIILNSDGFHHLQFSARRERTKKEQYLKFSFLKYGLEILRNAGTVQEYRELYSPIGNKRSSDGAVSMKKVFYWGFIGIVGERRLKVRLVVRRIGDGNYTFWSVMPYSKIKNGKQKLFQDGIDEE